jgi:hypothetical protein
MLADLMGQVKPKSGRFGSIVAHPSKTEGWGNADFPGAGGRRDVT